MIPNERLDRALKFAEEKHRGQMRIGGDAYITHPIAVCEMIKRQGFGTEYQIAALFHDLLEDTDATEAEICAYGSDEILAAVKVLTKAKGADMKEYVAAIQSNKIAYAVKQADRLHNLQCALVADPEFKRKYIRETLNWYMDFSPEIRQAVRRLADTLPEPRTEFPMLYEPAEKNENK